MKALKLSHVSILAGTIGVLMFLGGLGFAPRLVGGEASAQGTDSADVDVEASPLGTSNAIGIPSCAFAPMYDGMDFLTRDLQVNSGLGFFTAPVYLPQGARITRLVVYGWDNVDGISYTVKLVKHVFTGPNDIVMANLMSHDSAQVPQKNVATSFIVPVVDNTSAAYYLTAFITGPGVNIQGVKILYSN